MPAGTPERVPARRLRGIVMAKGRLLQAVIMDTDITTAARIIWDWLPLRDEPAGCDLIFVFGSDAAKVPLQALRLYRDDIAPLIVVSGGFGRLSGANQQPEADIFADVLRSNGVPADAILVENASGNSGENIAFSQRLLAQHNKQPRTGIAVTTPLLSRRQKATLQKQWPEISWQMAPYAPITADERLAGDDAEEFLHLIVGEVDRLATYPDKGFMTPVDIPVDVLAARDGLADAGYRKYTLR